MSIELYSADLTKRERITHALSWQMSYYYNAIGKMTLILPLNAHNSNNMEINGIVYDTDFDMSFIIENKKIDTTNNTVTANGYSCNWLLNRRALAQTATIINVESGIYSMIDNNLRGLPNVYTSKGKGYAETTDIIRQGGQLLDVAIDVLKNADLGHRMLWNDTLRQHTFEIYKGVDRTTGKNAVVFSQEQKSAQNLCINDDNSTFRSVIYVKSEYNDTPIQITVPNADYTGGDSYEFWYEPSIAPEEDETQAAFTERLKALGNLELSKLLRRQNFTVTISPQYFGEKYKIGDKITCNSNRYGVSYNVRIDGLNYTADSKTNQLKLILGEPVLNKLEEVKLFG